MLPTFIILGAAKCATTSVHMYLNQHPQVVMSKRKETHFFCNEHIKKGGEKSRYAPIQSLDEYEQEFPHDEKARAYGESSPLYLYYESSAMRIHSTLPEVKLIAILRNPAERAYSAYLHMVRDGHESLSFEKALAAEAERKESGRYHPGFYYRGLGYYSEKLRPYYDCFSPEKIAVYSYEEVSADAGQFLRKCCDFIGVDSDFRFDTRPRMNVSGIPKNRWLHNHVQQIKNGHWFYDIVKRPVPLNTWIRAVKWVEHANYVREQMNPSTKAAMMDDYAESIDELRHLTGRDFAAEWSKPARASSL